MKSRTPPSIIEIRTGSVRSRKVATKETVIRIAQQCVNASSQPYDEETMDVMTILSRFEKRQILEGGKEHGHGFKNEINGGTTRLKFQFWISFFLPRPLSSGKGSDGLTWSDLACRVRCLSVDTLVSQKYACFFANLILCSARDIIMFC